MAAKNIPYGVTDFRLIRANNYYYVDKTSYIALVENAARFFFLIRPRRFGKSLFVNDSVPANNKDMLKIATESFQNTELKLLGLVKDRSLVDVDKLPSAEFIRELYELDSNISENRIEEIMRGYEMKIDLFSRWQKGEDLKKIVVNFKSKPSNKNMKDIFVE